MAKKPAKKKKPARKAAKKAVKKPVKKTANKAVKKPAAKVAAKTAKPASGPKLGSTAPEFSLPTDGGGSLALSELRGRAVILYFYPRDDTPGCTIEACAFRDTLSQFSAANAAVIGISTDSVQSHDKFKAKYGLNFVLAADEEHKVADKFGVWVEKNRYGRKYMGTERATFLIDADGKVAKVWRNVKVDGHAGAVLEAAKGLGL